jgi:hypothetical protein
MLEVRQKAQSRLNIPPYLETVVKAFRPPDAIKYSHAKPQEISLERRID